MKIRSFINHDIVRILGLVAMLAVLVALTTTLLTSPQTVLTQNSAFGRIQVQVVDGNTEKPLADCTVVVVETGKKYQTNSDGKTELINLPILEDARFKNILSKPWGEVTLLVYHKGYITYALFYTQVWENEARQGPKIYLFPEGSAASNQPFIVVEGPQRIWVNDLIKKFAP